jgi:hypothetical protein
MNFQSEAARSRLRVSRELLGDCHVVRVNKQRNRCCFGNKFVQQFKPLRPYSACNALTPVRLPPGRLRLATNPASTGSAAVKNTIGMWMSPFWQA